MLVDLGRNDLGRVCRPGTVTVDELMEMELYSHVIHMVSSVSGELDEGQTPTDALKAAFPAGTVSAHRRCAPCRSSTSWSLCAADPMPARSATSASAATSTPASASALIVKDGVAHVQAGAGIVADTDPGREFEETQSKAAAL